MSNRLAPVCCTLITAVSVVWCAAGEQDGDSPDPFMGDWQGTLKSDDGKAQPLCAQVINWGRGDYQANLLAEFDKRERPVAVLKGKRDGDAVVFGEAGRIAEGAFTGKPMGEREGAFALKHVVRLSPTLGKEPPEGAVVLLGGAGMDQWQGGANRPWVLDLGKLVGGSDRVAYLRSRVLSPKAQPARLEIGSDDGVKAWLNGEVVHANKTNRPVRPWEDKADVELKEGSNELLLKICQGSGGWGACARVIGRDGKDLSGLSFDPMPTLGEGVELKAIQGESTGTIVTWELSGPYSQQGKAGPTALFDAAFPPEQQDAPGVEWKTVNDKPQPTQSWKPVGGGGVEITKGSGSVHSKRQFRDLTLHMEFRTPLMPTARGQGRGNSGVYLHGHEVQVLDSYGLEGKANECGGIYKFSPPLVNMCAPPLQWQTYDIEFRAERHNDETKKVEPATMTVHHNGVLIQDKVKMPLRGKGGPGYVRSGGILLQDHHNPVRYRNIWVVER